jgi:hypothetical protein
MAAQHTRWANRAEKRQRQADKARATAEAMLADRNTDWAFISQPGHIPARARELARSDRAFALLQAADQAEIKATNLRAMAARRAGDAELQRQSDRDAAALKVGDAARSVHYGPCTVVKVNAKSYRIRLASGSETTQDKVYVK